jgi:hypothetical protein
MIPAEEMNHFWILHLVAEKEDDALERKVPSINIVWKDYVRIDVNGSKTEQ